MLGNRHNQIRKNEELGKNEVKTLKIILKDLR